MLLCENVLITNARPPELVISSENEAPNRVVDGKRGVAVSVTHDAHERTQGVGHTNVLFSFRLSKLLTGTPLV